MICRIKTNRFSSFSIILHTRVSSDPWTLWNLIFITSNFLTASAFLQFLIMKKYRQRCGLDFWVLNASDRTVSKQVSRFYMLFLPQNLIKPDSKTAVKKKCNQKWLRGNLNEDLKPRIQFLSLTTGYNIRHRTIGIKTKSKVKNCQTKQNYKF